jgi:hypothetical protein
MINYPVYTQINYPPHLLIYLETALPLSNMDAAAEVSDNFIDEHIDFVETAPFSDQFEIQDYDS